MKRRGRRRRSLTPLLEPGELGLHLAPRLDCSGRLEPATVCWPFMFVELKKPRAIAHGRLFEDFDDVT